MAYWSSTVPSLNGNCTTLFFKWLHVYQYVEHTVEYNCHFRAGGETGECFQLWFMFVIRYVNTAVIDGIVNGTTRRGGRSTLSVPSCSPTGSEGPDQAFLFSQVVLSRLDPIAKTSFFFSFLFFKNKWWVLFSSLCYINFSILFCTGASGLHPRGGSGKP